MAPNLRVTAVLGAAAFLALIALFLPWWTLGAGNGGAGASINAAPFDDGQIANGVVMTGVFWILGLVACIAAVVAGLLPRPLPTWTVPVAAGVAALLFLLMPLLAISSWPPSGIHFWGSDSKTSNVAGFNFTSSYSAYANVGWYLALVAGVASAAGAVLSWRAAPSPSAAQEAEPQVVLSSKPVPVAMEAPVEAAPRSKPAARKATPSASAKSTKATKTTKTTKK